MLVFDIETDGLLEDVTVAHCINVIDRTTGKRLAYNVGIYTDGTPAPRDGTIEDGLALLESANCIAGHRVIWFDIPALKKLYPKWSPRGKVFDSLVCCSVIWTNLTDLDCAAIKRGRLSNEFQKSGLVGKQSLEAWGWRLGEYKGDFKPGNFTNHETLKPHTWKTIGFTKEMDLYGRQDPETTLKLIEKIESKGYSAECLELELTVSQIIFRQYERGFAFDIPAAERLVAKLQKRRAEIEGELQKVFTPWWAPKVAKGTAVFTPKKDNKKEGYVGGAPFSRVQQVVFNPGSRDHIADRLTKIHGWRPTTFTPEGKPQIDETLLESLPWPEAQLLSEYLMIEKRLGMVCDGKQAWIKHAVKTGIYGVAGTEYRIHGNVNTNGAVTGRMTHNQPNVAQTPKVGSNYGEDCRMCYVAGVGFVLVGCDAEGIELRALAHYMAKYDGGAYAKAVAEGRKEDKTDAHNINKTAIGMNDRERCKTYIYALIYGAQGYMLGTIIYDDFTDEQRARFNEKYPENKKRARQSALKRLGESRRDRLMENLPALGQLVADVKAAVAARGFLRGLDGRILHVRAEHSALNTLLQSAGAVLMKRALVMFDTGLDEIFRSTGAVVEPVANVHDEIQTETTEELAEDVGRFNADCIRRAGDYYKLRCPLAGSYGVGRNWRETH